MERIYKMEIKMEEDAFHHIGFHPGMKVIIEEDKRTQHYAILAAVDFEPVSMEVRGWNSSPMNN